MELREKIAKMAYIKLYPDSAYYWSWLSVHKDVVTAKQFYDFADKILALPEFKKPEWKLVGNYYTTLPKPLSWEEGMRNMEIAAKKLAMWDELVENLDMVLDKYTTLAEEHKEHIGSNIHDAKMLLLKAMRFSEAKNG